MEKKKAYRPRKEERTGEDIDMLRERELEKDDSGARSYRYRDNIDSY